MVEKKYFTHSQLQTQQLGKNLSHRFWPGCVVLLEGDLGAGKTTFVRGVAQGIGTDGVSSPTFALLHVYEGGRLPIYHIDAYRLASACEAEDIGLDEAIFGDGVCLIEWSQNIAQMLPKDAIRITLEHLGGDGRSITIFGPSVVTQGLEGNDTHEAVGD